MNKKKVLITIILIIALIILLISIYKQVSAPVSQEPIIDKINCLELNYAECKENPACILLVGEMESWGTDENGEPINTRDFIPEKCISKISKYSNCEYIVMHTVQYVTDDIKEDCRCCIEIKENCMFDLCPTN